MKTSVKELIEIEQVPVDREKDNLKMVSVYSIGKRDENGLSLTRHEKIIKVELVLYS